VEYWKEGFGLIEIKLILFSKKAYSDFQPNIALKLYFVPSIPVFQYSKYQQAEYESSQCIIAGTYLVPAFSAWAPSKKKWPDVVIILILAYVTWCRHF
jgi:hypothetical protein